MRLCVEIMLLVLMTTMGVLAFTQEQATTSEAIEIEARDTATDIYKCIEALKSEKEQVYEEANECLYYLLPRHTSALLKELKNGDPAVRGRLAVLFGKRRMKDATPEIIKLLGDENIIVRKNAVYALKDMGDPKAIPALMKLIREDDYLIWSNSIGALLSFQEEVSKEDLADIKKVLIGNLNSPRELVRRTSVRHLERIKDPDIIPILTNLSQNDTGFYLVDSIENGKVTKKKVFPVREAALKAIAELRKHLEGHEK